MSEHRNLPFQDQHYLSHPQHLLTLRDHLHILVQNDLASLQTLLLAVEDTLTHHDSQNPDPLQAMRQRERQFKVFQQLSHQNRDRSEKVTNLSQLIIHLLDLIEEHHHKTQQMQAHYQRSIEELNYQIQALSRGKVTVEDDVEIFREQLSRAREEIDGLLEEREEEDCQRVVVWDAWREKDRQIQLYQQQLHSLSRKLSFYKRSGPGHREDKQLRFVYSQSNFFPISVLQNQYEKMTHELQSGSKVPEAQQEASSLMECQSQGELSKALKNVLSSQSLLSLSRNGSGLLHGFNSTQLDPQQLSEQIGNVDLDFDILPLQVPLSQFHKISEGTEEQSLYSSHSRDIFDIIGEREHSTAASKDSDRTVPPHKGTIVVRPSKETTPFTKGKRPMQKERGSRVSVVRAQPSQSQNPKEGLCSSLLSYLVSKRIRRISQKANSGCSPL